MFLSVSAEEIPERQALLAIVASFAGVDPVPSGWNGVVQLPVATIAEIASLHGRFEKLTKAVESWYATIC
jgi:hypothetical protein